MEQDVLNLELLKHMPEDIKSILLFPPFIETRAIVMLIDGDTREKIEEKILALRNCLTVYAEEACKGYVDMGVSQVFTVETGFVRAYNESIEALKINEYSDRDEDTEGISMEDSSVTYYGDLTGQNTGNHGYNLVLDTAVKDAVDACDQARAFAITDEFLRDVSRSGIVFYEQQYYLQRFLLAILSVPADGGIPIHDLFPEGEGSLFARFNQLYDCQTIRKFYENQVISPVIARMKQFRKSSSEVVLDRIMALIEECRGDLTLSECADRLGYHPSYIWRVLKNTRDLSFTDYIARQKLEQAKKMLVETGLSVAEIAQRLSYSNAQNFIRLFKKHMGITPGQYRKQKKMEE